MSLPAFVVCPNCAARNCRPSRWRSHEEKATHPGCSPFRCPDCKHRFIAATASPLLGPRPATRILAGVAALLVSAAIIGLALLWPDSLSPRSTTSAQHPPDTSGQVTGGTSVPAQTYGGLDSASLQAARNGDAEAQFRLGRAALLDTSRGKEGTAEAISWLRRATAAGHTGAMIQLGRLYRSGVGIVQNYELAARWIREAAEQGDAEGMVELGRLYRAGIGVEHDLVQAYVWFNRAAAEMNLEGAHERENIALKLSPEQLKLAQELSASDDSEDMTRPETLPAQR
jgi:uncharacterized protein